MKDPISTSSTLCCYFLFFSSSCSIKSVDVAFPWSHFELSCVTLTSKNTVTPREVGCVHHRAPRNAKPQILSSDFAFIPLILKHVLRWLVGTKHVPESKNTWTLGSVWDFGTCFGFWEMDLDPVTCFRFWTCFLPMSHTVACKDGGSRE